MAASTRDPAPPDRCSSRDPWTTSKPTRPCGPRGAPRSARSLGADHLARRDASTSAFNGPLRALSEEFAYGTLWARPGLGRRERSLITLAMLCALNRPHEVRMHVKGALANGVSVEEISETLTHAAAYCGLPAAIDALAVAEQTLKEIGRL